MENEILRVNHLKKFFKTPKGLLHAVDDVTFSIDKGKTLGVVGESGCGKSTLGRTILHLLTPTSGEIWFEGKNISQMSAKEFKESRKQMQIIFQDPYSSLNPRMTVEDIITEPLKIFNMHLSKAEREQYVTKMMDAV